MDLPASAYNLFTSLGDTEKKNNAPTWNELQELETERREILKRVEDPFWKILSYWSGTCLRSLSLDWLIWITILIFVVIRVQARTFDAPPGIAEQLGNTNIDILGGFLSFLLVLFVNQTNSRFFEMYQLAKRCSGQCQDVAGLASTQLPREATYRLVRYMNAAQIAGYVGLGGPYTKSQFFDHFNKQHNLLTDDEMERVAHLDMNSGSAVFKELVTWCQKDVRSAQKAGHIDSYEAGQLNSHILTLRGSMDGIYDFTDQPVHYFYIHFLCLLSAFYLPLFAIGNGISAGYGEDANWTIEVLNGLIVVLQAIFVVGLRLLGQKMVDPFGEDLEDLSVITYVSGTIENCRIIMESHEPPDVDSNLEKKLRETETPVQKGENV